MGAQAGGCGMTSDRTAIFGASGSGKTSVLYHELHRPEFRRVILFDPLGEARGWRKFRSVSTDRQLAAAILKGPANYRLALECGAGQEAARLDALCWKVIKLQAGYPKHRQKITLAVDELNLAFPLHGAETKCPGFAEICSRGRHHGIDVIAVSQRVAEVSQRFRGNLSGVVVLRQMGKSNVEAGADLCGVPPDRVRALKQFEGIAYQASTATTRDIKTKKIPLKP